ncbi:folate-binding protein YgfZ [Colletotrichum acutatum]|uniref:Iron-sulfur cluster assembly factor IBA57 homolog, mitochondrial n=1 Tax=Glomerella acutata TaxID=27357 RepID=A0AAD9D113_GLOAC|nr:folate-binding protein YgfZ [Colletotrichum acutatum]KAK1729670.1 folate-binding protein YgfZ [Colletotrichum acutatum]
MMNTLTRNATLTARKQLSATSFVCRTCRQQQRRQCSSTNPTTTAPPPAPPSAGYAALSSRRLISVAGADAAKFLQGVITGNIASEAARARKSGFYAAFLNATGRVLHDVFIYPDLAGLGGGAAAESEQAGTRFLIEVDANEAERLAKHIKRYKLRAKLTVRLLAADEATVWHAWNDSGKPITTDAALMDTMTKDPRTPGLGYRVVQGGDAAAAPPGLSLDLDVTTEDSYTIRRYLQGVAEGQDEVIREHALPQETNMDYMNGIDYHKGCYVGQELTIRTKHRGVVRKRILPCMIYDVDRAAPQTLQYRTDADQDAANRGPEGGLPAESIPRETSIGRSGKKGRSAGKWLKGIGNVGLGLCRLEIMTDVVLPGETAASTFDPTNEFLLKWGEGDGEQNNAVKIKAFVPEWLRNGLNEASG